MKTKLANTCVRQFCFDLSLEEGGQVEFDISEAVFDKFATDLSESLELLRRDFQWRVLDDRLTSRSRRLKKLEKKILVLALDNAVGGDCAGFQLLVASWYFCDREYCAEDAREALTQALMKCMHSRLPVVLDRAELFLKTIPPNEDRESDYWSLRDQLRAKLDDVVQTIAGSAFRKPVKDQAAANQQLVDWMNSGELVQGAVSSLMNLPNLIKEFVLLTQFAVSSLVGDDDELIQWSESNPGVVQLYREVVVDPR